MLSRKYVDFTKTSKGKQKRGVHQRVQDDRQEKDID